MLVPWKKSYDQPNNILKSRDITLHTKVGLVKAMVFPVVMYGCELDHKAGWALKNWWFWTVVLEKTLVSPLDCKEIKPVNPKGNQSWILIGRTDAEARKDWRQEEKGTIEDKMVGWHHWLNRLEIKRTPGDGEGQGSLPGVLQSMGLRRVSITEQHDNNN